MLLTTHDLYDLHAVFLHIRRSPDTMETYAVTVRLWDLFKTSDFDPQADGNTVRRALRPAPELDRERYFWVDTDNAYAYCGKIFRPEHPIYALFRAAFGAIFGRLKAGDTQAVALLADALHNIPLILCEPETKGCRRRIERELTEARGLMGADFLREELRGLPR